MDVWSWSVWFDSTSIFTSQSVSGQHYGCVVCIVASQTQGPGCDSWSGPFWTSHVLPVSSPGIFSTVFVLRSKNTTDLNKACLGQLEA